MPEHLGSAALMGLDLDRTWGWEWDWGWEWAWDTVTWAEDADMSPSWARERTRLPRPSAPQEARDA